MSSHIATNSSFDVQDQEDIELECAYCIKKTKQRINWLGTRCLECNMILDESAWRGHLCQYYRQKLNVSKSVLADMFGCSKHMISSYEQKRCPDKYWNWIRDKVKESYAKESGL